MSLSMVRSASSSSPFLTRRSPPDPYGGDFLPFDELAGRRLRHAQVFCDLWHVHEAVGQVVRFGCRGGDRSPYLRPGILAAHGIIIRYSDGRRERVTCRLEDVVSHGVAYLLFVLHLVRLGCNETQGASFRLRGQAERYLMEIRTQRYKGR